MRMNIVIRTKFYKLREQFMIVINVQSIGKNRDIRLVTLFNVSMKGKFVTVFMFLHNES